MGLERPVYQGLLAAAPLRRRGSKEIYGRERREREKKLKRRNFPLESGKEKVGFYRISIFESQKPLSIMMNFVLSSENKQTIGGGGGGGYKKIKELSGFPPPP